MPFAIAAVQTQFPGFALTKDESAPLVPMADMIAAKWMPQIGPYGVEVMFCVSILGLAGVKYMAFLDFKHQRAARARAERAGDVPGMAS